MRLSTISPNRHKRIRVALATLFWIVLWQILAMAMGQEYLLASPVAVLGELARLLTEPSAWLAALRSGWRILIGFFAAAAFGAALAFSSARLPWVRDLAAPLVGAARSVPVASFVILAIILVSTRWLSTLIAFVIGFPLIFGNVTEGIKRRDQKLKEVAQVFRVPGTRRLLYLDLPQIFPYFKSGAVSAMGLCWKSGIAAELIGIPNGSIGERLYMVKVNLYTAELFAWTVIIVTLSALASRLVAFASEAAMRCLEKL
ncbi:MAG: ABC transporter permease [Christensenellales bacterium]|jgi:NitT/TauT family transport system permease protein